VNKTIETLDAELKPLLNRRKLGRLKKAKKNSVKRFKKNVAASVIREK
jgi:hypothetical protein